MIFDNNRSYILKSMCLSVYYWIAWSCITAGIPWLSWRILRAAWRRLLRFLFSIFYGCNVQPLSYLWRLNKASSTTQVLLHVVAHLNEYGKGWRPDYPATNNPWLSDWISCSSQSDCWNLWLGICCCGFGPDSWRLLRSNCDMFFRWSRIQERPWRWLGWWCRWGRVRSSPS